MMQSIEVPAGPKEIRMFKVKISQYELAKRCRVSQPRISLIENGLVKPTHIEKAKIAAGLGVDEIKICWPR